MSVVNHFEISLICLLHCMYYDITTNNKLIVFGGTLIGQFQVYNLIIKSLSALIMILQSARSLQFTAANCYGRTQEAQFPPLVRLIVSVSDNNYGHSILDQELWNLYSMYKILWTETPTKLLYTDLFTFWTARQNILLVCVSYGTWNISCIQSSFFIISPYFFPGAESSPHCHIYSYTVGICDIVAVSKFIKF